ncbi:MAG: NAD-dependent epimerase/dehydratase family protein [Acidimicrobiia bacterium]
MAEHVVFGTGPLGVALIEELVAQGETVLAANRSGRTVVDGVETEQGDASDAGFVSDIADGARVVYLLVNPPYHKWLELFETLHAAVVDGAIAAGAEKIVALENLYLYGHPQTELMSETHPIAPSTRKGRLRADMHRSLMEAHAAGKIRAVAVRPSDYFGPRTTQSAMDYRVFGPAMAGKTARVLGNPAAEHSYSFTSDIGKALAILGRDERADGQVWHPPSPPPITAAAFVDRIAAAAGTSVKTVGMSPTMLKMVGLFNKPAGELVEMLYEFEEPFRLDTSKFESTFGIAATPLDEAIAATVEWYRAHPPK